MNFQSCGQPLQQAECDAVTRADPLKLDAAFAELPSLNEQGNVERIAQHLKGAIPSIATIHHMEQSVALASMRDLGLLAAAIKRHKVEPLTAIPELELPLLALGAKTDMIPRETVFHYTVWNPSGSRQRQFTKGSAEDALIRATRIGAKGVELAIAELLKVSELPVTSPDFAVGCEVASAALESMILAVDTVRREVPPAFFAHQLRPFFEEIVIGGKPYNGAAAAPLSLGIVDHLLWSSAGAPEEFLKFQEQTMRYNRPTWRHFYDATRGAKPISVRALEETQRYPSPAAMDGCRALAKVFQTLLTFRGRHLVLARSAYQEDVRLYPVGSAGYGVDTLQQMLIMTRDTSRAVRPRPHA